MASSSESDAPVGLVQVLLNSEWDSEWVDSNWRIFTTSAGRVRIIFGETIGEEQIAIEMSSGIASDFIRDLLSALTILRKRGEQSSGRSPP